MTKEDLFALIDGLTPQTTLYEFFEVYAKVVEATVTREQLKAVSLTMGLFKAFLTMATPERMVEEYKLLLKKHVEGKTILVAAHNSSEEDRKKAKFVCEGRDDQLIINKIMRDEMKFIIYQPGNGTRYDVFMQKIEDPNIANEMNISPGGWFVGLPNIRTARCYAFQPDGYLDVGYVESHLFSGKGQDWEDAKAITQLLGQVMQRKIRDPWKQCQSCGLPIHPNQEGIGLCVGCEYKHKLR